MRTPHHTVLFNVTCRTILKLTPEQEERVWNEIEDTMNGDRLYGEASKEVILEAYFEQHSRSWDGLPDKTWIELVKDLMLWWDSNERLTMRWPYEPLISLGDVRIVCQNTKH
jgi:hypothetical protein